MSDIDLAVSRSKRLEGLLERHFGATGRGLHEKADSARAGLPAALVKKLHFVATIRNKVVHESDYTKIDDRRAFVAAADDAERELKRLAGKGGPPAKVVALAALLAVLAVLIAWMYFKRH